MGVFRRWKENLAWFFNGHYFDSRHKTKVHIFQIIFVVLVIALAGARIATLPADIPTSRSDTIGIVMGIKTIIILSYQLITTHAERCKRWSSTKAYAILNCLEIPFWFVVVIITFMGISRFCEGVSCGLSWILVLAAACMLTMAMWMAVVSVKERRYAKMAARRDAVKTETMGV